jgi:hypothetical protein
MRLLLLLLALLCSPTHAYPLPQLDDVPLDCALRAAAHAYAQALQGGQQAGLFAALNLSAHCGAPPLPLLPLPLPPAPPPPSPPSGPAPPLFYLDALHGSDAQPGTAALPFASLPRGLAACRAAAAPSCTLLLRDSAPYVLRETLALTAADSGLTLAAAPGAAPVLTGAAPVGAWAPLEVDAASGRNIWRAQAAPGAPLPLALLAGGRRLPRARWPNAPSEDWETARVPDGYTNASAWHAPLPPRAPQQDVPFPAAARPFDVFFPTWVWGRGGAGEGSFEPPEGYWLARSPTAGVTWAVPAGFLYDPQRWSPRAPAWDASQAIVKAFHGAYWGSWAFAVGALDAARGNVTFSRGGWQEARGWRTGGALYVENVRAELDAPREWFAFENGTVDLWWPGPAGSPPPPGAVSLAALRELISITGSAPLPPAGAGAPAANITLAGLTLTGTQTTFMEPFVAPSGGDWSFSDAGAVRLEGTAGVVVSDCSLVALGGNGVLLRGWNRGALLQRTAFARLGESGVVSAGRAALGDLSALDVPAGTRLVNCSFSDLGVEVKQAGGLYSALSANTSVEGCVFYSLPRAAININDGAHGGHVIARNVFAATVLETSDHGAINTWEREPYVQTYDTAARTPRTSRIERNFLLPLPSFNIHSCDHDDGSNAWEDTRNVLVGAGFKNWQGFNRTWRGNLIVRPDYLAAGPQPPPAVPAATPEGVPLPRFFYFPACVRSLGQAAWGALGDIYAGNTCILRSTAAHIFGECNASAPAASGNVPRAYGNAYYVPGAAVDLRCGGNMSLARAQSVGWEAGSSQHEVAELAPADVVAMARDLLGF